MTRAEMNEVRDREWGEIGKRRRQRKGENLRSDTMEEDHYKLQYF